MKVTKQTPEQYAGEKLPNLYREMKKAGVNCVLTIESPRALAMAYQFENGGVRLCYGSESLLDRYLSMKAGA